jgi:predicted ATP-grasp superfamily ATP-dependent carboligase
MTPAIVLSSHTMGLGVIRSLGKVGIPVIVVSYEKSDMGYCSKYVKKKYFSPHPEREEKQFNSHLLDISEKFEGAELIPADDATLTTVSKNLNRLSIRFKVASPEWSVTEKFIDKKNTYELAHAIGVPAPISFSPEGLSEVKKYAEIIQFPCLVKPRLSHIYFEHLKKKMVKVFNKAELINAYNEANSIGSDIMVQEYIPGGDESGANYNSYFIDGIPVAEFTARKCRLNPPESGVPRVVKSLYMPELFENGRKIIKELGFNGFSCTEFKKDARDGKYKLMEVNGRHNRSGLLAFKCGINFPLIEYNHLTAGITPEKQNFRENIYWVDEVADLFGTLKYFRRERYSISAYIKPYKNQNVFAVFDRQDLKPVFKRGYDLFRIILSRIFSIFKLGG